MYLKRLGFTMVEVLIVTLLIGMVSQAVVPRVLTAIDRSRDTQRMSDISKIAIALNMYYADESKYPVHNPNIQAGGREVSTDATWLNTLNTKYLHKAPVDPQNRFLGNPWLDTGSVRTSRLYTYYQYGTPSLPLYDCILKDYVILGVTELEASPPQAFAKCPGLDRSTVLDYGYILSEGYVYNGTNANSILWHDNTVVVTGVAVTGAVSTGSVVTGTTTTTLPGSTFTVGGAPLSPHCPEKLTSQAIGSELKCYCGQADGGDAIAVPDDNVRGTNEYKGPNSKVCESGVHAGAIPAAGGNVWILVTPPRSNYVGSTKNGVTSKSSKGQGSKSFKFLIP